MNSPVKRESSLLLPAWTPLPRKRRFLFLLDGHFDLAVLPFSSHFERSEKSLFRPKGEIRLRPLACSRDDSRMITTPPRAERELISGVSPYVKTTPRFASIAKRNETPVKKLKVRARRLEA